MCVLCQSGSGTEEELARRVHVLQLLVLVEHLRMTNPHHFVPEHQPRRRAEPQPQ